MVEVVTLMCDYSGCRRPILDNSMGYLPPQSQIYHEADCLEKTLEGAVSISERVKKRHLIISREKALELRAEGYLAQSPKHESE